MNIVHYQSERRNFINTVQKNIDTLINQVLESLKNNDGLKLINEFKNIKISYVIQKEQLGLGHAVLHAKDFVNSEPFAVLSGDDLFYSEEKPATKQLIDTYYQNKGHILGTMIVPDEDTVRYGICDLKPNQTGPAYELQGLVEKPQPHEVTSRIASCGRWVLDPIIFKYLETQKPGIGGEIQLTDAIFRSIKERKLFSYNLNAIRYDVGSKEGYLRAVVEYALRRDDLKENMKEIIKENS